MPDTQKDMSLHYHPTLGPILTRGVTTLMLLLALAGCGVKLPPELQQDPPGAPVVEEVRKNPDAYHSQPVRWGGIILDAQNRDSSTWISVVAVELDGNGRPYNRDRTLGRFIAVVDQFLEPMTYRRDRLITVSGLIDGLSSQRIGDFDYDYPVVRADVFHLWPKVRRVPLMNPYPAYYWPYRYGYHPLYNPFPHVPPPHVH